MERLGLLSAERKALLLEVLPSLAGPGHGSDSAPRCSARWRVGAANPGEQSRSRLSETCFQSGGKLPNASGLLLQDTSSIRTPLLESRSVVVSLIYYQRVD